MPSGLGVEKATSGIRIVFAKQSRKNVDRNCPRARIRGLKADKTSVEI
jgi:hypothetical protein